MHTIPLCLALCCPIVLAVPPGVMVWADSPGTAQALVKALDGDGLKPYAGELNEGSMADADVLVLHQQKFEPLPEGDRAAIEAFARRGGGVIGLHGAIAAGDAAWAKPVFGAAWTPESRRLSSHTVIDVATDRHPLVDGAAAIESNEEAICGLDLATGIEILATSSQKESTGDPDKTTRPAPAGQGAESGDPPQIWAYESTLAGGKPHRAVVMLQGTTANYGKAGIRTILRRAVAWAARRDNVDEFCTAADIASLRQAVALPSRPKKSDK
ncbi:ThuA domain-containing protein [Luteolibacter marinus]|uniref:ThuA domain-containing protein n=1 Tax=Luteolibacter marinus TaxID=2776705 RepID=UPI00186892FF|nr:ThuA domain-containing protein [Luteolibacter marinus]